VEFVVEIGVDRRFIRPRCSVRLRSVGLRRSFLVGQRGSGGRPGRFRRRLEIGEFAHQLLFEIDAEIIRLSRRHRRWLDQRRLGSDRRNDGARRYGRGGRTHLGCRQLRRNTDAWVETHDPGQFGKRIVVSKLNRVGDFSLVALCHSLSRTRTKPDARDVIFRPLPAQCGQKVTVNSLDLAHFPGRIGPDQRQTGRQNVGNGLHQP